MKATKQGSARWQGGIKDGAGHVSTESGVLSNVPYGFNTRFEGEKGSNPEELIGAAHASCFSMALSKELGEVEGDGRPLIETKADVTLESQGEGFAVTKSHLTVLVNHAGADEAKVREAAEGAKANCPISKLLNADITMDLAVNTQARPKEEEPGGTA